MKSISVFVKNLTSGGAEKQSVLLAKALADDYNVHYIIFNGEKVHLKYMDMLESDKRICICSLKGGYLHRFKMLVHYLQKYHIKVLFSYLTAANVYACMVGKLIGVDVYTGLRNARLPKAKLLVDRMMANWFAIKAVANCFSGKEYFVSTGFKKRKIVVIPNCLEHIESYREKGIAGRPHIITVGRFVAQKDYQTAIRAVAEVKNSGIKMHFDIVGYGKLENEVRGWVKQYGLEDVTTIYINPENIAELLDKADVYLSTSLFEGTSNSIMEAMNADLPVVCTNVGDNACLVSDGKNGYLTEVGDVNRLAEAMIHLLEDVELRKEMGRFGKRLLTENYSMESFREAYRKLL